MKEGKVIVDADRARELLDEIRKSVNEKIDDFGRFLTAGLTAGPPTPTRQRKAEKASTGQFFELEAFDINAVNWKTKNSDPAGPDMPWSWAFSTDVEGHVLPETAELVQACKRYGEVRVGSYIVKLGGRDGNLLNRRRAGIG